MSERASHGDTVGCRRERRPGHPTTRRVPHDRAEDQRGRHQGRRARRDPGAGPLRPLVGHKAREVLDLIRGKSRPRGRRHLAVHRARHRHRDPQGAGLGGGQRPAQRRPGSRRAATSRRASPTRAPRSSGSGPVPGSGDAGAQAHLPHHRHRRPHERGASSSSSAARRSASRPTGRRGRIGGRAATSRRERVARSRQAAAAAQGQATTTITITTTSTTSRWSTRWR